MNTPEVWTSIITNGGSVQHLEFLDDKVKNIFKTAIEINQRVLVEQGGDRQVFMSRSTPNLFFQLVQQRVTYIKYTRMGKSVKDYIT